jgi:hypothetical protein
MFRLTTITLLILLLAIAGFGSFGLHYALAQSGGKSLDLNSAVSFPVDI